jgi:hypothetical protein
LRKKLKNQIQNCLGVSRFARTCGNGRFVQMSGWFCSAFVDGCLDPKILLE